MSTRVHTPALTRMRARTSFKEHSQVLRVDPSQVIQKSQLRVLSLTGSIVKAKTQTRPCAEPVEVEAAAPTGLPLLCSEWEMHVPRCSGSEKHTQVWGSPVRSVGWVVQG